MASILMPIHELFVRMLIIASIIYGYYNVSIWLIIKVSCYCTHVALKHWRVLLDHFGHSFSHIEPWTLNRWLTFKLVQVVELTTLLPYSTIFSNMIKVNPRLRMQSWKTMFNKSTCDLWGIYIYMLYIVGKNIAWSWMTDYNSKKSDIKTLLENPLFFSFQMEID